MHIIYKIAKSIKLQFIFIVISVCKHRSLRFSEVGENFLSALIKEIGNFHQLLYSPNFRSVFMHSGLFYHQHGDFNTLMWFNGKLATVPSWPDDGDRDSQFRHALNATMEGKCCGLKPNPMRDSFDSGSGFPGRSSYRMHVVLYGRRGVQHKSSFDVCLNDFEWERLDWGDSSRKQGVAVCKKHQDYDYGLKYLFCFQYQLNGGALIYHRS